MGFLKEHFYAVIGAVTQCLFMLMDSHYYSLLKANNQPPFTIVINRLTLKILSLKVTV